MHGQQRRLGRYINQISRDTIAVSVRGEDNMKSVFPPPQRFLDEPLKGKDLSPAEIDELHLRLDWVEKAITELEHRVKDQDPATHN